MIQKVYIPGFWNTDDDIHRKYIGEDSSVIQENIRPINPQKIQEFLEKYWDDTYEMIHKQYPGTTKEVFDKIIQQKEKFRWWTRDMVTTVTLTDKALQKALLSWSLELFGHSQWALVAMLCILQSPKLLDNITHIELLAPVSSFPLAKSFHKSDEGYLHGKNIVVREQYIKSLWSEENILEKFLDLLEKYPFTGKVKLIIGKQDTILSVDSFNITTLRKKYPFLEIEMKEGDHYLWYKK